MKLVQSVWWKAAAVALALAAMAGTAQARSDVYWSVGIDAAPGVTLGVGNHRPVYVQPAPVYVAPQPVYVAPPPVVVYPRSYYVQPAPVYYASPVYYDHGKPRHHKKWRGKHRHRHYR